MALPTRRSPNTLAFWCKTYIYRFDQAVFPHMDVHRVREQGAAIEVKEREIRRSVKRGEKQALECLRGILNKTVRFISINQLLIPCHLHVTCARTAQAC